MLALVNGQPKVLNILQMLEYYLDHQKDVVTRRTRFDLNKAEKRAHIVQGLLIALDNIDRVIQIIRGSESVAVAKQSLMEEFALTDVQAQEIVDMRLRALTGLEREKLEKEYADLLQKIDYFKSILADENKLMGVIRDEISLIAEKYGDDRRTQIIMDDDEFDAEDLIPAENTVVARTKLGYIKRMSVDQFKAQNRGGRGIKGMQTIEDDYIEDFLMTSTHFYVMFFTNLGRVYRLKAYQIPESSRTSRGVAIINLLQLSPGETVSSMITMEKYEEDCYLIMATKNGIVKKTPVFDFLNIRKIGIQAITLLDGDELIGVKQVKAGMDALLVSANGQCMRFNESDVRPTGRSSMGVRGMRLDEGDELIGMQISAQGDYLLFVTENGMGKKTRVEEFPVHFRGGKGVRCYNVTEKTGKLVAIKGVVDDMEVMMITNEGVVIRTRVNEISTTGRVASGVKLINVEYGEDTRVVGIVRVWGSEDDEEASELDVENAQINEELALEEDHRFDDMEDEDDTEND
jgi:DNA gyrase subunit A